MNSFLLDYIPIIIFLGIAIGMALLIMIASWIVAKQNPDDQKLSPYECGFDLEVAFLFPWAVSLGSIGLLGFWSMMAFLGVLTVGFIYEWKKGALEWE